MPENIIDLIKENVIQGRVTSEDEGLDERLNGAKSFGATHVVNSTFTDPVQEIQKITGVGVDYSLECTGVPTVLRQAVDAVAIGGIAGLIGGAPPESEVSLDHLGILNGRTVRGIVEGDSIPSIFIPQLIDLYKTGRFPFDRMTKFYPFEQINQAVEDSEQGKTLKAILRL